MVNQFLAELFGTALLILLGDGVVANIALKKTKGNSADLIVVTVGWAIAVAIPVYIFSRVSGAVFNPAVTIALGITGGLAWNQVVVFCIAQFIGAFIGAVLVYLTYYTHFESTEDHDAKLGTFCTIPAIRNYKWNFFTEFIGTFVLMFGILGFGDAKMVDGIMPIAVGLLILVIGVSLGGPTGYAINPARDFSPRLAHFLLPMKNKGGSDWAYAWIPIVGPILGAIAGAIVYTNIF
ncbi:TPA: aquaporin family protein [Clostridium perfringens]|uniref:MIP/aquaporin family protein n=1 Tax=Clostridium perfringens TaxID=1502 RepID=UPI000E171AA4|nr:MIP/aquaporin family protein [Clostridium perfringens]EJT6150189.1 aquaporin family protein [Clostridium perfringens]EJT6155813.1 aquaporin family protein [Clostridium perfringens]UBK58178.1 aquaporin family protein [Clostridium perfringens]UBK66175.1 aquaporin family protein [Clostridium perfringens]SUY34975.1 glycerol uptake facilitator protein [Clostridium perfringens]